MLLSVPLGFYISGKNANVLTGNRICEGGVEVPVGFGLGSWSGNLGMWVSDLPGYRVCLTLAAAWPLWPYQPKCQNAAL